MILHLNKALFKDAVSITADQLNIPPEFVEKDYWEKLRVENKID
jgi:hypothetical protein